MTREQYSLYLDEIYTGGHFDYFCLAGFATKSENYSQIIIPEVEKLKEDYFEEGVSVVLHEQDIFKKKSGTPFQVFQSKEKRTSFWKDVRSIFESAPLTCFGVAVHKDISQKHPHSRVPYFIALQTIIENFIHFLVENDGYGKIYVESSNSDPHQMDEQLQQHFHYLKANGTLLYDRRILQMYLGTISLIPKVDNIIGLQLADLLPNSWNRELSVGHAQRTEGLINTFHNKSYQSGTPLKKQLGTRIIS